jgi:3-methyladenine DNA glycosylase/8-oxoguanine DNA glycosylase
MGMTTLALSARQPFNFHSTVNSHGWVQLAPFTFDEESCTLSYVDRLASGRVVAYRIRESPGGVNLEVNGKLTGSEQNEVARKVTWMLGLDLDFTDFYAATRGEPKLAKAELLARGRVLRSPTLFEDVLKTILTTNTLWAATKRMNSNIIAQFGEPLPDDESRRAFPTPERLARVAEKTLREKTRLGYRAPYVRELARTTATGKLDLEALKTTGLPTDELRKELMKIKGIGAYAAANLLMILGRSDFIPIDSWALKVVSHEWHDGQAIGPAEVETAFEKWGKWRGLAYWFWDWKYMQEG